MYKILHEITCILWYIVSSVKSIPAGTWRNNNVIIATSFWRNNDVITSCVRWDVSYNMLVTVVIDNYSSKITWFRLNYWRHFITITGDSSQCHTVHVHICFSYAIYSSSSISKKKLFKKYKNIQVQNGDWNPRGFICPVIHIQFTLHNTILFCDNTGVGGCGKRRFIK